ncbi:unnamed protein product, partial [Coregonus sp. 'balchen']
RYIRAALLKRFLFLLSVFHPSISGLSSVEAYNYKTNEWMFVAPMNTRRSSVGVGVVDVYQCVCECFSVYKELLCVSVLVYLSVGVLCFWLWVGCVLCCTGKLYAVGGYDGASRQCLSTVEEYNPVSNQWGYMADMSTRRSGAGVGVLSGQLYAAGGHDGPLVRKSVEVYDPPSNTWKQVCDMNMCRRNAGVCAINGLLYVIGGDDGSCNLSSVEYYNPATDKWSLIPTNMSNGRSYAEREEEREKENIGFHGQSDPKTQQCCLEQSVLRLAANVLG